MTPVTKQDVQQAVDRSTNNIAARMLSKNDVQTIISSIRSGILQDIKELHSENQAMIRNGQARHEQINQRLTTIERQLQILVHEMAKVADTTSRTNTSVATQPTSNGFSFQRI